MLYPSICRAQHVANDVSHSYPFSSPHIATPNDASPFFFSAAAVPSITPPSRSASAPFSFLTSLPLATSPSPFSHPSLPVRLPRPPQLATVHQPSGCRTLNSLSLAAPAARPCTPRLAQPTQRLPVPARRAGPNSSPASDAAVEATVAPTRSAHTAAARASCTGATFRFAVENSYSRLTSTRCSSPAPSRASPDAAAAGGRPAAAAPSTCAHVNALARTLQSPIQLHRQSHQTQKQQRPPLARARMRGM